MERGGGFLEGNLRYTNARFFCGSDNVPENVDAHENTMDRGLSKQW